MFFSGCRLNVTLTWQQFWQIQIQVEVVVVEAVAKAD